MGIVGSIALLGLALILISFILFVIGMGSAIYSVAWIGVYSAIVGFALLLIAGITHNIKRIASL